MQTSREISKTESQHGQALVEFALVLLFVILPFTFVLVDGAMTLFTLANVTNAAREGARAGSIYQTLTPGTSSAADAARFVYMKQEAQSILGPLVAFDQCYIPDPVYNPVTATTSNPYRERDTFTFRIECPRRLLFGLVGSSVITLTAQATMRIEPGGAAPQ